jgi:hypothetical protein
MLTTLMLGLGLLVVIMLVGVNYVVNSFGIMRLMQVKGYENVYRAWIPFYNDYILGEMVEDEIGDSQLVFPGVTRWIMCLYPLAGAVPAIGELAVSVGAIYFIVVLCIFADKYKTTASMVISSIFCLSGIGMMILASRIESGQPSYSNPSNASNASSASSASTTSTSSTTSDDSFDEKKAKTVDFEVTEEKPASDGPVVAEPEQKKGFVVAEPDKKTVVTEVSEEKPEKADAEATKTDSGEVTIGEPELHEYDVPLGE